MSEPDDLLERLGGLEREYDDTFPHAWEDVARGERTTADVLAERQGLDDPRELAALAESLRPITPEERAAWVDRLAGETAAPASPPRGRLVWLATSGAVLAAAGLAMWAWPRSDGPRASAGLALPSFSLEVRNETVHDVRDAAPDESGPDRYQPGSDLHWVIRAEGSVALPLGLRVLAEALSPEIPPPRRMVVNPGPIEVSEHGVIELRSTMGKALPRLKRGRWSLRMIVAEPGALPADTEAFDRGGAWRTLDEYEIEIVP